MEWLKECSFVNRMIFPAQPSSYGVNTFPPGELRILNTRNGDRVPVLVLEPQYNRSQIDGDYDTFPQRGNRDRSSSPWILYLHGNAADLGDIRDNLREITDAIGIPVIAVDYPGYGLAVRKRSWMMTPTSESSAIRFAAYTYDYAVSKLGYSPSQVIVWGHSIGSGVASALTHSVLNKFYCPPRLLVLQSPFTCVKDVARIHHPLGSMMASRFDNLAHVRSLKCPLLIIHGHNDTLIPCSHAKALHDACPVSNKHLVILADVNHSDFCWQRHLAPYFMAALAITDIPQQQQHSFVDATSKLPLGSINPL